MKFWHLCVLIFIALLHLLGGAVAQGCDPDNTPVYESYEIFCYSDVVDLNWYLGPYQQSSGTSWTNPLGEEIPSIFTLLNQPQGVYTCHFFTTDGCPAVLEFTIEVWYSNPLSYVYVCEGSSFPLAAAFPMGWFGGGMIIDPNGLPSLGFFNSNEHPYGLYLYAYSFDGFPCYFIDSLYVLNPSDANAGTGGAATSCNGESFSPFELLGGTPSPGGNWLLQSLPDSTNVNIYPWNVVLDPAVLSPENLLTYRVGSSQCNMPESQLHIYVEVPIEPLVFHIDLCEGYEPFYLLTFIIDSLWQGTGNLFSGNLNFNILHWDVSVSSPAFLGFYPTGMDMLVHPDIMAPENWIIFLVGGPPCITEYIYCYITVHEEQSSTESVITCLPYEWNGALYFEAGEYAVTNDTAAICGFTETLVLSEISGGVLNSAVPLLVCNGVPDGFSPNALLTGQAGTNSAWLVLEPTGDVIVDMTTNADSIAWAALSAGSYLLQHVCYSDDAQVTGLSSVNDFQGCFDVSSSVPVEVVWLNSGVAGISGSAVICTNQPPQLLPVAVTGWSGPFGKWVLTDAAYNIMSIADTPSGISTAGLAQGTYYAMHAVLPEENYLNGNSFLDIQSPCIALSNFLEFTALSCFTDVYSGTVAENTVLTDEILELWGISVFNDNPDGIRAEIFDVQGRLIEVFYLPKGSEAAFTTTLIQNTSLNSGVYFYRLHSNTSVLSGKLAVIR